MEYYLTNSVKNIISDGITSGGAITSYQVKAGTVIKGDTESEGRDEYDGLKNIAELYYDNRNGKFWIDGTTGSGIDFRDTRDKLWNNY